MSYLYNLLLVLCISVISYTHRLLIIYIHVRFSRDKYPHCHYMLVMYVMGSVLKATSSCVEQGVVGLGCETARYQRC